MGLWKGSFKSSRRNELTDSGEEAEQTRPHSLRQGSDKFENEITVRLLKRVHRSR